MSLLVVSLSVGLIPTGHFSLIANETDWLPDRINLGNLIYPDDCDGFPKFIEENSDTSNHVNLSCWLQTTNDVRDDEICGLRACTVEGKPFIAANAPAYVNGGVKIWFWELRDRTDQLGSPGVLPESPAMCFFGGGMNTGSQAYFSLVTSLMLLAYGLTVRVSKVFERFPKIFSFLSQERLDQRYEALLAAWERRVATKPGLQAVLLASICLPLQASFHVTFCILLQLYTSMLAEVSVLYSNYAKNAA